MSVSNLPSKKDIAELYESYTPLFSCILENVKKKISSDILLNPAPVLKSRIKLFKSYYNKAQLQHASEIFNTTRLVALTDMIGIRIVCAFLENIPDVERQISQKFNVREIEHKGADKSFREFSYESVHVLIDIPDDCLDFSSLDKAYVESHPLPNDFCCEIQIRTILQDAWAEVEHELIYKTEFSPFDAPLRRKLACVNASLSLADTIFQEIRDYQKSFQGQLDERRQSFYQQADIVTDKKNALQIPKANEPAAEPIGRPSPYVHGTIDDMILRALQAHNAGDLDLALDIYTQIILSKNSNLDDSLLSVIYKHRGMAYFAKTHYNEAFEDFEKSATLGKNNFRSVYYMGIVQSVLENYDSAIEYFDKSLIMNAFQPHAYFRRALAKFNKADIQGAFADLNAAERMGLKTEECKNLRTKIMKEFDIV